MKKTKKHIWLVIIAIIIAGLAFGYAYLTTTLSINGITDIDRNSWDVYFDNVQVTQGSVTGEQEIEAPTITSDTEVEFHVNLKKPGDFYEFTIEARNDGTIDAMINSISKKLNGTEITTLPAYLDYRVTYIDGSEIEENHLLESESLLTYKIRVEYKSNISASDLPSTPQSLDLSFETEFVQADSNAKEIGRTYYTTYNVFTLGTTFVENDGYFDTPEDAMNESGYPIYGILKVFDNKITAISIGVKYRDKFITIKSGGANYNSQTGEYENSKYFNSNKTALDSIFDSNSCEWNNEYEYICHSSSPEPNEDIRINKSGSIFAEVESHGCNIDANGTCFCGFFED
ncbi:MAG: hypothetical protein IKQ06_00150 [Bacilli bacterium]|nr:hypothetical protein [Bacilli bacterium]